MKTRFSCRKPDTLILLALFVSLGMFLSTNARAAESLFDMGSLSKLLHGDMDMKLVPVGKHGGVRMTLKSPSQEDRALYVNQADNGVKIDRGIRLSVKVPW
jgi:hypothetical protein